MDMFSQETYKQLLSKEWLIKVNRAESVPYLLKFYASQIDLTCCLLITDTKTVWGEVMSAKQMARRWRECNPNFEDHSGDALRPQVLEVLSMVHTIGGIEEVSFEVVDSIDADLAFELDCEVFKWRWDAYLLGPKTSAEILSKHLLLPLISMAHMSFYSPDPVSELTESDLEMVVDKIGRTARRTVDMHIKHAISKPRVATTLQRISALFNFTADLPPIRSEVEKPNWDKHPVKQWGSSSNQNQETKSAAHTELTHVEPDRSMSPGGGANYQPRTQRQSMTGSPGLGRADSTTEESSDEASKAKAKSPVTVANPRAIPSLSPEATTNTKPMAPTAGAGSSSDCSPPRPAKKRAKNHPLSSSDSEADVSATRGGSCGATMTRGVRQPVKRGAKRF